MLTVEKLELTEVMVYQVISLRKKQLMLLAILFALAADQPASANNLPAPYPFLAIAPYAFILIVMVLSAVGGTYAIQKKRVALGLSKGMPAIIMAVVSVVGGAVSVFLASMLCLYIPVALWSTWRGFRMITWGLQKQKSGAEAPDFLQSANPSSLIISGVIVLGLTTVMMQYWHNHIWTEIKRGLTETSRQINDLEKQADAPSTSTPSDTNAK